MTNQEITFTEKYQIIKGKIKEEAQKNSAVKKFYQQLIKEKIFEQEDSLTQVQRVENKEKKLRKKKKGKKKRLYNYIKERVKKYLLPGPLLVQIAISVLILINFNHQVIEVLPPKNSNYIEREVIIFDNNTNKTINITNQEEICIYSSFPYNISPNYLPYCTVIFSLLSAILFTLSKCIKKESNILVKSFISLVKLVYIANYILILYYTVYYFHSQEFILIQNTSNIDKKNIYPYFNFKKHYSFVKIINILNVSVILYKELSK